MRLLTLFRSVLALLLVWTTAALSWGTMGLRRLDFVRPASDVPVLADLGATELNRAAAVSEQMLVDRRTGELRPLQLAAGDRWGLISVAPWRDSQGRVVAAGRWVKSPDETSDEGLWGIGVIELPEGEVVSRRALDVLPTGRPCWLTTNPGVVIFPAGDGRLYRFRVEPYPEQFAANPGTIPYGRLDHAAEPLRFACQPPAKHPVVIADPATSTDPRLQGLVFVSMSVQTPLDSRTARQWSIEPQRLHRVYEPGKIWWLALDPAGTSIRAAGRLELPRADDESGETAERHPNIAVEGDHIRLIYLTKKNGDSVSSLRQVELEIDRATGRPRVLRPVAVSVSTPRDLSCAPLLVSTDGRRVFGLDVAGRQAQVWLGGW